MSELSELDDTIDIFDPGTRGLGTCQAKTRAGKRCRFRAEVKIDGTAYCVIHAGQVVEIDG